MHTTHKEKNNVPGSIQIEDGPRFEGYFFGRRLGTQEHMTGEVVFNTGMVGYPETLTDPSYRGQILVFTYPLIGNYGVPMTDSDEGVSRYLESNAVHVRGVIVCDYSFEHSHYAAVESLDAWLRAHGVPGLYGVDTRALTKHLRERGTCQGMMVNTPARTRKSVVSPPVSEGSFFVDEVSVAAPVRYERGKKTVVLVDCGAKHNIIRSLLVRNLTVIRIPWDYDFSRERYDGIVVSNGPGDPTQCEKTIQHVRRALGDDKPIFGICLGNQILALAAGASTYKLPYGHRGQNQPCIEAGTNRCVITSQNHGYAVDESTLPRTWKVWYRNLNDNTNEGIRHTTKPFMSVQFHPEATPGPTDSNALFDTFTQLL